MTEDFIRNQAFMSLGSRLKRLGERMQADVQRLAKAEGFDTPTGLIPTVAILGERETMSIGALAEALGVSQPGATRNIAQLAALGLVSEKWDRRDKRVKTASLTAKGKVLFRHVESNLGPRVAQAVEALCGSGRHEFLATLASIEDGLDAAPLDERASKQQEQ